MGTPERDPHRCISGLTSLVGRTTALDELRQLLIRDGARLVTLHGDGGVGKTRLAEEIFREISAKEDLAGQAAPFDDAAVVPLAGVARNAEAGSLPRSAAERERLEVSICQEIVAALEIHRAAGKTVDDLLRAFAEHLAGRRLLLVLDNCELLTDEVAEIAECLLADDPELQILTTSRIPLNVHGEYLVQVRPLAIPDRGASRDAAARTDAVRLFCDRAAAAGSRVDGWTDWPAVVDLVRMSGGVPLVLELLAAQLVVGIRTPTAVLHDLMETGLLKLKYTRGRRRIPPHHSMLEATVTVSWDACDVAQQRLWCQLSTFAGSFTLAAAGAVCAEDPAAPATRRHVGVMLEELIVRSVVTRTDSGRYVLRHSWLRDYGEQRLLGSAEERILRERHYTWITNLIATAARSWFGPRELHWLHTVHDELPSIDAAVRWCCDTGQIAKGYELVNNAARVRAQFFYAKEYRFTEWYKNLLTADTGPPSTERIVALCMLGFICIATGNKDHALAALEEIDDLIPHVQGAADHPAVLLFRGIYLGLTDSGGQSLDLLTAAAHAFDLAGDQGSRQMAFLVRALVAGMMRHPMAEVFTKEAITHAGNSPWAAMWTRLLLALPGMPIADDDLPDVMESLIAMGDAWETAWLVLIRALVLVRLGKFRMAAHMIGCTATVQRRHGVIFDGMILFKRRLDEAITKIEHRIGRKAYADAYRRGQTLSTPEIYQLATRPAAFDEPLSPHQLRIVSLVAQQLTNREIATRLNSTESAITQALTRIRKRILLPGKGRNDRPALVAWFRQNYPHGLPVGAAHDSA
ncbi:ATP-binding protein [Amycolatopsis panacis]|uniref:HTH luxR-type domain-containing protein n=1 Tax=Amycolatopsis panacis TaxID=2340917 RepID=A0A419IB14_9PSEU|nr:AAA family ATPase [Amycolatopsis panacis]RJQ91263.1 hypothetical protein D5S19_02010 [Amycolatopsis panacis]